MAVQPRLATQDQKDFVGKEISLIEEVVSCQSLNSLFEREGVKKIPLTANDCYAHITAARQHLSHDPITYDDFTAAKEELDRCWTKIDTGINLGGWTYKIFNVFAIDVYLFYFLVILAALLLPFFYRSPVIFGFLPPWVPAAGAMGASFRNLWDLKGSTDNRTYCRNWKSGVLSTPFIGAIIALGVYPAYFIASRATAIVLDMPAFSISVLSGYGWRESINLLDRLTQATLGSILSKVK